MSLTPGATRGGTSRAFMRVPPHSCASLRKLIIVSATFRRDVWYPEIVAGMEHLDETVAEHMKHTPIYQGYQRIAPRPQDWPALCKRLGVISAQNYDLAGELSRI